MSRRHGMIMILAAGIVLAALVALGIVAVRQEEEMNIQKPKLVNNDISKRMSERVTFQTSDGVTIVGDWTAPTLRPDVPSGSEVGVPTPSGVGTALLLHMMPATRSSWKGLSEKFAATGIATLAIDLRGHGESTKKLSFATKSLASSTEQAPLNYRTFTDADHQASRLDVDASLAWLKTKGYATDRVIVIGASIGANLALDAAARYPAITKIVMLSGGLDYHGVKTDTAASKLHVKCQMLLVASADDDYSLQSHRTLANLLGSRATVKEFQNAGHGTTMFSREPKLIDDIVAWVVFDRGETSITV